MPNLRRRKAIKKAAGLDVSAVLRQWVVALAVLVVAAALVVVDLQVFSESRRAWLGHVLVEFTTACLVVAILELSYKRFLHRDLVRDVASIMQNPSRLPVRAVFLDRLDLPEDQQPRGVLEVAREEVYIKAISFNAWLEHGLIGGVKEVLEAKKDLHVHFMVLSPDFQDMEGVASLTDLDAQTLRDTTRRFIERIEELRWTCPNVDYVCYDSFPTIGCWIVDPRLSTGWCRIETYLYRGEQPTSRTNIVIDKRGEAFSFFRDISSAIADEYARSRPLAAPVVDGVPDESVSAQAPMASPSTGSAEAVVPGRQIKVVGWPNGSEQVICLSYPTLNLTEMRQFYADHDIPTTAGVRGANSRPPRTDSGVFRLVDPRYPDDAVDVPFPCPSGFVYDAERARFLIASQTLNAVFELCEGGCRQIATHPLFNHLHYIDCHSGLLAVASSGTDSILVFDAESGEEVFVWLATENGYNRCRNGDTRTVARDENHNRRSYPTLQQTTHVNSVVVSRTEVKVLYASLFHQGEVVRIDMRSGETRSLPLPITHPHGLKPDGNGGYVVTEADRGTVMVLDSELRCITWFRDPAVEWLQDACRLNHDEFAYTDVYHAMLKVHDTRLGRAVSDKSITGMLQYEPEFKVYQIRDIRGMGIADFAWMRSIPDAGYWSHPARSDF